MTCKNKKNDYNVRTRHNVYYWNVFVQERIGHGLP